MVDTTPDINRWVSKHRQERFGTLANLDQYFDPGKADRQSKLKFILPRPP